MKKLIISALFLTAFSSGLFAKESVEVPIIEKVASEVPKVNQEAQVQETCMLTSAYYCEDGKTIYIGGEVCVEGTENDWYNAMDASMASCD